VNDEKRVYELWLDTSSQSEAEMPSEAKRSSMPKCEANISLPQIWSSSTLAFSTDGAGRRFTTTRRTPALCLQNWTPRNVKVLCEQLIEIYNTKKEHHIKNKFYKKIFILKHDKFIRIFFNFNYGLWKMLGNDFQAFPHCLWKTSLGLDSLCSKAYKRPRLLT
jgi:hypothetical protein